jgi:hypothetical protein
VPNGISGLGHHSTVQFILSAHEPSLRLGRLFPTKGFRMTEFVETAMRHMCRNPKCRMRLPAPVSNEREAFCTRGCYQSFYLKRCRVCERPIEQKRDGQRLLCKKPKCKAAWQALEGFGRYAVPSAAAKTSKTPDFIDSKQALKPERTPVWRVVAAGVPITANQYYCAIVGAEEAIADSAKANERLARKVAA